MGQYQTATLKLRRQGREPARGRLAPKTCRRRVSLSSQIGTGQRRGGPRARHGILEGQGRHVELSRQSLGRRSGHGSTASRVWWAGLNQQQQKQENQTTKRVLQQASG